MQCFIKLLLLKHKTMERVHEANYFKCEVGSSLLFQHNTYYMLNITESAVVILGVLLNITYLFFVI